VTPLGLESLGFAFAAGLASVASPCVPAGGAAAGDRHRRDHRSRPALVVAGLASGFIAMGVAMSLFGAALGPSLPALEKCVGVLLVLFGLLLLLDLNPFKRLTWLQSIQGPGGGRWSGLLLGASLGLVWIPCVGPVLSGVLLTVASRGSVAVGVALLAVYAAGFAVPMLAVGYGSQALRQRVRAVAAHPVAVRWGSGLVLVLFGALILKKGMLFAGM
jgi:cytochrome c-type biogenesis protein